MRDDQFTIERVKSEKGYDLFILNGPITLSTLFNLQDALLLDPVLQTIIDLTGVPYVDSAGLGALLSFHATCRRNNRKYALTGMPARVYTMFAASKVDQLIHILPTLEEAEAYVAK
jgi:anti-sigma B factor antagonist